MTLSVAPGPRRRPWGRRPDGAAVTEGGCGAFSFLVDDVDSAAQRLTRCGGSIVEGTRSTPGIDIVFLADPGGVRVELMAG